MNKFFLGLLISVFVVSCHSNDSKKELPECIKIIIEAIQEQPVQSPKANIEIYLYKGREVYLLNAQNFPDGQSFVYNLNGENLRPLGGIDGTRNDCENFDNAKLIETIWVDPR